MNIGTAIKMLRKKKGFSQTELGEKCNLSVNALSQIETNVTFPQKGTIKNICQALEIPVSYLLFFAINDEDIPEEKRAVFNSLNQTIKSLLLDEVR
jgi:transcriptional regulator with XRE-family HTH domain